jgi:hypothetical protein
MIQQTKLNLTKTMMKSSKVPLFLLASAVVALLPRHALAQSDDEDIAVVRSLIKADHQQVVEKALQLTDTESQAIWPVYRDYRAEMDQLGDGLVKVVKEYAGYYPDVPEDKAARMLKNLTDLENKQVTTRAAFIEKFGKILPAAKTLRLAQVENRLDLVVKLKLASSIPLAPIEGRLTGGAASGVAVAEGVPGGVAVRTYELTATVASIDKAKRKVTLIDPSGIKATVKAGPEVVNFDQINVGDQLKVRATEQLAVYVVGEGEAPKDDGAQVVALAPKGVKPGGLMADTTQVAAKVAALDEEHHRATLEFEDGTIRTVPVRADVDLSKRNVGDKVVIRTTESLAISVDKP